MTLARDFLSAVLPWEQAGEGVFFNLHWKAPSDKSPKGHYWAGRAYTSLDEMVSALHYWSKQSKLDMYVCMSSQSRFDGRTTKEGKLVKHAMRFQANVVGLKGFYIDVDVKPEAYPTQRDALDAFRLFIEASDMPMPTAVVGSGSGGFHAHWSLDRPITVAEWQPIANALAHACQHFGLICDTQCTVDSVRILRVPGTLNHKTDPAKPVTMMSLGQACDFEDIKEVLAPFIGLTPIGNPEFMAFPFDRRQPTLEGSELSSGIVSYESRKPTLEQLATACPFIEDSLCDGGRDNANPLWHLTLQAANFVEEGREAAHLLSHMHEDYDPEETDAEFDRVQRNQKERDLGWPTCDKIKLCGAPQCAACPLYVSHKSPFNFAVTPLPTLAAPNLVPLGTPRTDIWPAHYSQRPDGLIYFASPDDQGTMKESLVCSYQISNGWLQDNPWVLHFTCITAVGKPAKIEVPLADLGGMGGARKCLAQSGVVLGEKEFKQTQEFLLSWIRTLQNHKNSVVSSTPFGWALHPDGSIEGFTYAGNVWGDGTQRPAAQSDPILTDQYSPHGALQPWIEAAKLITNQKRPGLDAYIGASFGAPLLRFTGHDGALVAGYSDGSGVGKSTAVNVAQAVWGHATKAKQGLDDTPNALFGKMGRLKALPVFWDELQTYEQQRRFAKSIFTLTSGNERARLTAESKIKERGDWKTILVAASNTSLVEAITTENKSHNAGLYRLYEFRVEKPLVGSPGQIETGIMSRAIGRLNENFGHPGLMYAQFIGAQHVRIAKEVGQLQDHLNKKYNAINEERFWLTSMVLILAGARYSNELGLTQIDLIALEGFLADTLNEMRVQVKDSPVDMSNPDSVINILAQFLNAMQARHTLTTSRIHVGQGKPVKGAIIVQCDATKLDGIYVQRGLQDNLVRISSTYLHKWLADREMPRQAFTSALEKKFGFKKVNGIIGAGTPLATGAKEYIYEITVTDRRVAGFLEAAE